MKHTRNMLKFILALSGAILLFAFTLLVEFEQVQTAAVETGQGMSLQPPAFLKSAHATSLAQVDFSFLLDEAGITAYTNLNQELDLEKLKGHFKTIRQQTNKFVIGIMTAPGYEQLSEFNENVDIQVFLHRDGWIVAYLTQWQTAAEIFDWISYEDKRLTSTLPENVVHLLAFDTGVADYTVGYYDFRHPEATQIMLVAERVDPEQEEGSFNITIPRELTIYETSWSYASFAASNGVGGCSIADEYLGNMLTPKDKWVVFTGELIKSKFPTGTTHKLHLVFGHNYKNNPRSYCGIAIVYQEAK